MRGHEFPFVVAAKVTSRGSSESAAKDWHVNPAGPVSVVAATTTTPVAKCPTTSLNCAELSEATDARLALALTTVTV